MNASNWLLLASIGIAALGVPLVLKFVPPNRIYGFRTPRMLTDRELWYRVNRFAGWAMLIAGGVSALIFVFIPLGDPASKIGAFVLPLLVALAVTGAYVRKTHLVTGTKQ